MQRVYIACTSSAPQNGGGGTPWFSGATFHNNTCVTKLELFKDNVSKLKLEDSRLVLDHFFNTLRYGGMNTHDNVVTSVMRSSYALCYFIDFSKDLFTERNPSLSDVNVSYTGNDQARDGLWTIQLSVNPTTLYTDVDQLLVVVESLKTITSYPTTTGKPPLISN
jgi:hypothetical protein